MKKIIAMVVLAAALWTFMFCPLTAGMVNFWMMMTASGLLLSSLSTYIDPNWTKNVTLNAGNILLGIAIAVGLWGVFYIGDIVSSWMFGFARDQVDNIYGMKSGMSPWVLSLLLLFIIGPAEEIFWRGFVQRKLSALLTPDKGWIIATLLYALVHVGSCNFMLVMASLVAGAAWGTLYRFFPDKFGAIILSHALWDAAVFVWFPI